MNIAQAQPPLTVWGRRRRTLARTWAHIGKHRWLYVLLLPGAVYLFVFEYIPLLGNIMAFQDYNPFLGFRGSPWIGLANFQRIFSSPDMGQIVLNTVILSGLQLLLAFPVPIVLALMLNEVQYAFFKRTIQSILYLPHFLSWVILIGIWYLIFNVNGLVNNALVDTGVVQDRISFLTNPDLFRPSYIVQTIWQSAGWGTIIFLAGLSGISVDMYEAAAVDGASRWQRLWNITLPGLIPIIVVVLILRLGSVLNVGFMHVFLTQNSSNTQYSQVLDTYVYYRGLLQGNLSYGTAVGLLLSIVGTGLVLTSNWLAKRFGGGGIF